MTDGLPTNFCPYKGLQPYTEVDRAFFFGRERDQEIIASNLYAAPLTVLYGESGVGKSSVLLAGVVPLLRQTPKLAVVVFRQWQNPKFIEALKVEVSKAVAASTGKDARLDASLPLDEFLIAANRNLRGPVFFIFDQFEEFFLYHAPLAEDDAFDAEWARAVNRQEVDANFLVSMREDGLSRLDRFRGRIPKLLSNMLRLKHLDHEAGRSAIVNPLEKYNKLLADAQPRVGVEEELVLALLDEVKTGRVTIAHAGQGQVSAPSTEDEQSGARIETPFLQMVLTRLWNEERDKGSHTLRLATLRRLGGAERIIRTHLDKVMEKLSDAERDVAARLFRYLVTPSGTKIAHTTNDLISYAELSAKQVEPVLKLLCSPDVRILRPIAPPLGQEESFRYEIFHDVLAQAVLDWHARYTQEQKRVAEEKERAEERAEAERKLADARRRARQLRFGTIGLSAILLVTISLLFFVVRQRGALRKAQIDAYSRELSAYAMANLDRDPDLSLLLAIEAARVSPTDHAVEALKGALALHRTQLLLSGHEGAVRSAAFSPDGQFIVTAGWDKTARVWKTATGENVSVLLEHAGEIPSVAFSADGQFIVTASWDKMARVWEAWQTPSPRVVAVLQEPAALWGAAFSPDGRYIVTSGDNITHVWEWRAEGGPQLRREIKWTRRTGVYSVVFSPDGKYVAIGSNAYYVSVWEWEKDESFEEDAQNPITLPIRGAAYKVAFSPDGKYLAAACTDRMARIWDWTDTKKRKNPLQLSQPQVVVRDVAFSQNSQLLATSSEDGVVRLWEWQIESERDKPFSLRGHQGFIYSVAFNPDNELLVTGGEDKIARVWRTQRIDPQQLTNDAQELLRMALARRTRPFTPQEHEKYLDEAHAKYIEAEAEK